MPTSPPRRDKAKAQGDRFIVVTGGCGAIGGAVCGELAKRPRTTVVLTARELTRAQRAAKQISELTGGKVVGMELDVCSQPSVRRFAAAYAERFKRGLDVLINNAAVVPAERRETTGGVELTFATNVLGYFLVMRALLPSLRTAAERRGGARVVNVAR